MRILQINNVHYRRGGADIVYLNTGELLNQHGHSVFYFSQKNYQNLPANTSEFFVDEFDYFHPSLIQRSKSIPRFFYSLEAAKRIEALIKKHQPQIAHVHLYKAKLTPSIFRILKIQKIPIVITTHDYGLICPHNSMLNGKGEICDKCLTTNNPLNCITNKCNRNKLILSTISSFEYIFHDLVAPYNKYFDALICVSKFGYDLITRKKSFQGKVKHLYNFQPNLANLSPRHERSDYFLFYGRLSEEKGIMTLLKAFHRKALQYKLKIVGVGPLSDIIFNYIEKHGLQKKVILDGFKAGEELVALIRNASFIVVPSEWYENNPLTIIEAYANGKPVIGSRTGGIPEIILDNKTGFLFDMGDVEKLSETLTIAENLTEIEYHQMSVNAREFALNHFNPDVHYKGLMKIYTEVIANFNPL